MARQDQLDPATLTLVGFAAAIARGDESQLREQAVRCREQAVPVEWVEELLLQSLLIVGYPRTLVGLATWRKVGRVAAPPDDVDASYDRAGEWTRRGDATCRVVYGDNYDRLRDHVRALHPAVDSWMITEGYGRTLSRPGLDLLRRELCVVAQTAVLDTPRQLHSHLHGALHAGAAPGAVDTVLAAVGPFVSEGQLERARSLWARIRDKTAKADRADKTGKADRADRAGRADRADKTDKTAKADRADKTGKADRADKTDKTDRSHTDN